MMPFLRCCLVLVVLPTLVWGQAQVINGNRVHAGWVNYGTTAGTATAYTLTFTPALPGYVQGQCFLFKPHLTNTGAATLNVQAKGALALTKESGGSLVPLAAGDLLLNRLVWACHDGSAFQLMGTAPDGTGVSFGDLTGTASDAQIPHLNTLSTGLTASRCVQTDATGLLVSTGTLCGTGGGGVGISGTPVVDQVAVWTNATTIRGTSTLSLNVTDLDLASAVRTRPNTVGTTPPATCSVGDTFYDTTGGAGGKLKSCETAPSGWTVVGTGGGSVDISGTPVADQFAVWVDGNTLTGTNTIAFNISDFDVATAVRTRPNTVGTTPPATCAVGDTFYDTTGGSGAKLKSCETAPSGWTVVGTSSGSVDISGTPVTDQFAVWVDGNTLTGTNTLSFNVSDFDVATATRTRSFKVGTTPPATCEVGDLFFDSDAASGAKLTACETAPTGWVPQASGGAPSFPLIGTSAANPCLAVGPNGATNPSFSVNCSVASALTGLQVTPAASAGGVTLEAMGSTNENMTLAAKGSGALLLSAALTGGTNGIILRTVGVTRLTVRTSDAAWTPGARASGVTPVWSFTGAADTGLTAGSEAKDFVVDLSQTKQHAGSTGITLQRHMHVLPGTDTCAAPTCTITADYLLSLGGPPSAGTNALITTSAALNIESRALTNVTNGYGLTVDAPTGATTLNAAAWFRSGPVFIEDLKTAAAGAGKRVVCVDVATGRLYMSATATDCS